MSGKLDQSLEDISKATRTNRQRAPRGGRRAGAARGTAAASAGVQKNTKASKATVKAASAPPPLKEGKIIISNLPHDVLEPQLKEYFGQVVGPVKRVTLSYGPNGRSRGIATMVFSKPESAHKAVKDLNNIPIDGRNMKIEVVVGAEHAPIPAAAKTLSERITQPNGKQAAKAQPKSAAAATTANSRGSTAKRGRGGKKAGKGGRGKPKTAEDLDAEMTDYFGGGVAGATEQPNGVAPIGDGPVTNGGDTGMADQIM